MSKYLKKCKFLNMIDNTVSRAKFDREFDFNGQNYPKRPKI